MTKTSTWVFRTRRTILDSKARMALTPTTRDQLAVRSTGWSEPAARPRMANQEDSRDGLELTSHGILRHGVPWIPVSGEIHYSRVPRSRWLERIHQLRSGGITVVACYVPWIHHVAERGSPRFDGNRDVAAFVDLVRAEGLDLVLRIGPWAHGELRNGGFPDWVQSAPVTHRTNDPAYMSFVREWWTQLATALGSRLNPETVLGIQLENELYEAPEHILELKRLARELGFSAPFWTSTAWGGAQLPDPEVLPVYGGYGDGFWVDSDAPWDDSFRQHYFFSHQWDDPGIGADLRASGSESVVGGLRSPWFPAATCELGGGMATAYHRRPVPDALDIAAIAHTKVGNGSSWQGYYMYVGGSNPLAGLQESHATGYPNDMPSFDYDFHAPIGSAGRLAPSHAALRRQHAFLSAFGSIVGGMPSHLPHIQPSGVTDGETLRWALRGDGRSGFLFVSWHQPHLPLGTYRGASFSVRFDDREVSLPSSPVDVPAGTIACWPVGLEIGGVRVDWLTATPLTVLDGDVPVLVVIEDAGIPIELAVAGASVDGVPAEGGVRLDAGLTKRRVSAPGGAFDVIVIPAARAGDVWVPEDARGRARRVVICSDEVRWSKDGSLTILSADPAPRAWHLLPDATEFLPIELRSHTSPGEVRSVSARATRAAARDLAASYGTFNGRPSAPSPETIDSASAVFLLELPASATDADAVLRVDWSGDVAALRIDGRVLADKFWDGSVWLVSLSDLGATPESVVEMLVLPLPAESAVHVPATAQDRRRATGGPLVGLNRIELERRGAWVEAPATSSPSDLEENQ